METVAEIRTKKLLTYCLFLGALALFYITNRHYAEHTVRAINKANKTLRELQWEYKTQQADLMYLSKQTEIAKKVAPYGLKESTVPPIKIVVNKK